MTAPYTYLDLPYQQAVFWRPSMVKEGEQAEVRERRMEGRYLEVSVTFGNYCLLPWMTASPGQRDAVLAEVARFNADPVAGFETIADAATITTLRTATAEAAKLVRSAEAQSADLQAGKTFTLLGRSLPDDDLGNLVRTVHAAHLWETDRGHPCDRVVAVTADGDTINLIGFLGKADRETLADLRDEVDRFNLDPQASYNAILRQHLSRLVQRQTTRALIETTKLRHTAAALDDLLNPPR